MDRDVYANTCNAPNFTRVIIIITVFTWPVSAMHVVGGQGVLMLFFQSSRISAISTLGFVQTSGPTLCLGSSVTGCC